MAIITTTSATPIYTAPGESWAIALNVKNNTSKTITGIKVECLVIGNDLGTDAGTVECGYLLGSKGTFADVSIAAGKSVNMHGYVTPPYSLAANFGQGVRIVPVYVKTTAKYKDGTFFTDMEATLPNVHVLNHRYSPQVRKFFLERALDGQPNDEGEDVLTTLKLTLSDDTKTDFMRLNLYYAENDMPTEESPSVDLTARIPELLNGVVDSPDLIFNSFSNASNWNFMLMFGDEYENSGLRTGISKAFANVHLSGRKTGGVCLGGFSTSGNGEPKFESHYPGYFYKGIDGVNIFVEDEIATGGRWIDNKPIYRRVISLPAVAADRTSTDAVATIENLDQMIDFYGMVQRTSGMWYPLSFRAMGNVAAYAVDVYVKQDGGVVLRTGTSTALNGGHMVCFYTRTIDQPIDPNAGYEYFIDLEDSYFITADDKKLMTEV